MAKQLSYKQIVRNMIEREILNLVWKNADKIGDVDDITMEHRDDVIVFEANLTVGWHDYSVYGAIDEYGTAWVSLIEYKRMRCTEKDENGDWITESAKPFTGLVYGEALKTFSFDK